MKKNILFAALVAVIAFALMSCSDDDAPTGTSNDDPSVPQIATGSGAPADGATDVQLTATLAWTCTDPDGDAVTYSVSFGTAATPPVVSASQSTMTYDPGTLAYSTTYYWKIETDDGNGGSSSTPVFSFTTMAQPAGETITKPDLTGPSSGVANTYFEYSLSGAVSSEGHRVEYYVDWGDGAYHFWSISDVVGHTYDTAGTYDIVLQARCETHPIIKSDTTMKAVTVTEPVPETVSTPNAPSGPASGTTGASLDYAVSGAVSSMGHGVEYRFAWGDSDTSAWAASTNGSHTWGSAGSYDVKAQARCATDTPIESSWSSAFTVTITDPVETIDAPGAPTGPSAGTVGTPYTFTAFTATSSLGHTLEYQFDLGDGNLSGWSADDSTSHSYDSAGTFPVAYQARCATHTAVVSSWSFTHEIAITAAGETITTPSLSTVTYGPYSVGNEITVNVILAESDYGDSLEYQMDWGDGTIDPWAASSWGGAGYKWTLSPKHTYSSPGSYDAIARARCAIHTTVMSEWSLPKTYAVAEGITQPGTPTGPSSAPLSAMPTFTTSGSTSSEGHALEYKFYYLNTFNTTVQYESPWSSSTSDTPVLTQAKDYRVRVKARCASDTTSESGYSGFLTFTITP